MRFARLLPLLLACGSSLAQEPVPPPPPLAELAARSARRHPQPVRVGDLVGRAIVGHLESMPRFGRVRDVVRRGDGGVDVAVDYGGLFALRSRPIRVPLEAMTVLGEYMEIVDLTADQLESFPTVADDGAESLPREARVPVALGHPAH